MNTTKAYLVEPLSGTIRTVAIPVDRRLDVIRSLIGCDLIDMVRMDPGLAIVVDDNGLHETLPCVTQVDSYVSPLAGNLLVIGTDANGDTVDVDVDIKVVAGRLTILRPVFDPIFETLYGPLVFGSRLSALEVRIDRQSPAVKDESTH